MKLTDYFSRNRIFTKKEFVKFLSAHGSDNPKTIEALLRYHSKQGHIVSVRRGLYLVIPPGSISNNYHIDPYLLVAKITEDAVLAYHTALDYYGKNYSIYHHYYYLTEHVVKPWKFQDMVFKSIPFPKRLKEQDHLQYGVNTVDRDGVTLRVTSNERTLVDLFDRPHWGGGWEEIWRSLESFDYFNINQVVEYALILGNATTVSKVGFFLEQHREEFMVEDEYLKPLLNYLPANPHYMERNKRQPGKLIKKWNLVVPDEIINRTWAEVL